MNDHESARRIVADACRVLHANGHADYVWGHVSARDAGGRGFWMKGAGLGLDEVRPQDVILVSFDGQVLEGDRARHSEWPIHAEILLARDDVGGVVHTHPPHAIALAAAGLSLLPVSHAGTLFSPPDVPRFDITANLVLDQPLGAELARVLGQQHAAFLVNHGIVTAGASLPDAVARAVLLEDACRQQLLVENTGHPPLAPEPAESLAKRATVWPPAHLTALWDYLLRTSPTPTP